MSLMTTPIYGFNQFSQGDNPPICTASLLNANWTNVENILSGATTQSYVGALASTIIFQTKVTGDINQRWNLTAGGTQQWGPGNTTFDTTLTRSGIGSLSISSTGPHILALVGSGGGGLGTNAYQARFQGDAGGFGAGLRFESVETGTSTVQPQALIEAEGSAAWNSVASATSFLRFYTATGGALTEQWRISAAGHLLTGTDNVNNIGASGATRPANIFWGTQSLAPNGVVGTPARSWAGATSTGWYFVSGDGTQYAVAGTAAFGMRSVSGIVQVFNTWGIGWGTGDTTTAADTIFVRDGVGIAALKNGTNSLSFRVYGTTIGSKYLNLIHNGTNAQIDASAGALFLGGIATQVSPPTGSDNGINLGTSALRWAVVSALGFSAYGVSGDANPQTSLALQQLSFGPGGATAVDTIIIRDAANTFGQRNGTNAQTFNIYNTYTSSTNNEFASLTWSSNNFIVATTHGSGGGSYRSLVFGTNGTNQWQINTVGNFVPITDNAVSIGTASVRVTLFAGTLFNVYHAVSDANASAQLGDGQIALGAGGATSLDTILVRDAANIFAVKNGTAAQTLRIYGTTTGPKYIQAGHNGTNSFIDSAASSGNLVLGGNASLTSGSDNGVDIGLAVSGSGGGRFRNIFAAGYASVGIQALTKTASTYTIPTSEQRAEYDNNGAGAQVAFTLPASAVGLVYSFTVITAQNVRISGNGADQIRVAGSISTATTGHIDNATVGGFIRLTCHVAGTWIASYTQGAWTVT